ncbi:sulfite exporter TauE/SafE family protein [Maritimibacter sp. DP1N21-5]|uniref:sulfite exporter TauE/SafE family protein n=1 Tax=Maritimibacter sp. DP1N21-5 TaxID=2836867 RepID=UPI001C495B60|nr:sulfite exporter TauE/SafE family protein [Maritimibacter sp. DP1N21-5]MBV7407925.1 sulfite exporter TauE/SafE family protein [Maritimibacter sp. DP1N21-5]
MDATLFSDLPVWMFLAGTMVLFMAGFVKGAVGFALPMITISGLGSFLPAELALAVLIAPTFVANVWQASRQGWRAALASAWRFRVYLGMVVLFISISAQLVAVIPDRVLFLAIGGPLVVFGTVQLVGWTLRLRSDTRTRDETIIGAVAGFIGGMSGIWGPPTVLYLTAIDAPKAEAMRVQGVIYGLGAVVLLLAHLRSGVLNAETLPLSLAAVVPALVGMGLGYLVHDRMPQATFRRAMLFVLVIAGLNLIRRGLIA